MVIAYSARGASGFGAAAAMPLLGLVLPLKVLVPAWTLIGIAAGTALIGSDLPGPSRLFIGWFGPRGIGTLVLGLLMIERGEIQQSAVITHAVVVAVTVSLVVHSLTVPLGIRLWPSPSPEKTAQES